MEKNSKVMLWGLEKASSSLLKEYEGQNNNPKSTIKQKSDSKSKKDKKPEKVVEKRFDPNEDYGIQDLPFLKKELERVNDEIENDIDYDENLDLQDKLMELIDTLDEMNEKFGGSGIRPVLEPTREEFEDIDGDSSDDEYGRGIEDLFKDKLKQASTSKKPKKTMDSKVRAEKGSDKAKEIGQKLAEARRKKREESGKLTVKELADKKREEKQKVRAEKAKPWYYVGIMPRGYREATEDEAIRNNKVGAYGKYVVDLLKYEFYEKNDILLSYDLTDDQIRYALLGIPKKINRSFLEIEICEAKLENHKHAKDHNKYETKLNEEKHYNKNLQKAYNWIYKLYCKRHNKEYKKKVFTPPEKEEIVSSKTTITEFTPIDRESLDPRLTKQMKKEIKEQTHYFENAFHKIALPFKIFDKDFTLKPKQAKKLFEQKIVLHPEHYKEEDTKKYFFNKAGKGITSKDMQKLISAGYKNEMSSIGDNELDPELSNETTRTYKNNKTGQVYVVHRGTKGVLDWANNLVYGLSPSLYKYTNRYRNAKDIQEKALEKYGDKVDVIGHSQGAKIAEIASRGDKRVKNVITYNRPVGLKEAMLPLEKNHTDIRSSYDPVSIFAPFQRGNKPITVENKSWNPLQQHNTSVLIDAPVFDIGTNGMEGEGIVNRKPPEHMRLADLVQSVVFIKPHWKVSEAKKWIKEHGYYNDEVDNKPSQIRFRQYNPEDLKDRHFISKKLKDENILLIISRMNNRGSGFMINNVERLTQDEQKQKEFKEFFDAMHKHQKENERLDKEMKDRLKTIKKATKSRVSKESNSSKPIKGSEAAKEKMRKVRAGKGIC